MQHNSVTNMAYHSSTEFESFFQLQSNPHIHDWDPLHSVGPYNYHGSSSISSMLVGVARDQARRNNDEKKERRLASNRESARRSRMRRQRLLNDLLSRVTRLWDMNQNLLVELNRVITKHAHIVHENAQLREEASGLQKKLNEMGTEEAGAEPRTPEIA